MSDINEAQGMGIEEFLKIFEYLSANGSYEDKAKFADLCEQAAEREDANIHIRELIGSIYAEDYFVKHDYDKAYKFLKLAADAGSESEGVKKLLDNSLAIGDRHIVVCEETRKMIAVYSWLHEQMESMRFGLPHSFQYNKINSFAELFPIQEDSYSLDGFTIYGDKLHGFCNYSVAEVLKALDVHNFDAEDIYDTIFDNPRIRADEILTGIKAWYQSYEKLIEIKRKYDRLKATMQNRPSSYGTFQNNGNGIKGALKASLLNMAVDAVAGTINTASDIKVATDIENELNKIYAYLIKNSPEFIFYDCLTITRTVLDTLIHYKYLPNFDVKTPIPKNDVDKVIEDGKNNPENYKTALDMIGKVIQFRPYNPELYATLCKFAPEYENDVFDFAEKNKMTEAFLWAMGEDDSERLTKERDYKYKHNFKFSLD